MPPRFDYKSLNIDELRQIFSDVNFKLEPRWHQYVSLAFAADGAKSRIHYFHDVGTGKTPTSIMTAKNLWGCRRLLVVCPSIAFGAWDKDLPLFGDYSHNFLTGTAQDRKDILRKWDKHAYVINYEGLKSLYAKLLKKSKTGNGGGWVINQGSFVHNFDCVIFDEVHKCKDPNALQSKICENLSMRSPCAIGLTGTPIDGSLLEAHNIMKVVDQGKALGTDFWNYRWKYFKKKFYDWEVYPQYKEVILDKMLESSITFDADECYDLPAVTETVLPVESSGEFRRMKRSLRKEKLITQSGKTYRFPDADSAARAIGQLSCGFFYYPEYIDGKKVNKAIRLKQQPKAKMIIDRLEATGKKIVVFYHYKESQFIIEEALKKAGIGFRSMHGGQDMNERRVFEREFATDPKIRVIVAQRIVANEGFDGTPASIVIHYYPVASPKIRKQTNGRIRRSNQTEKKLYCCTLSMVGSFDERIIDNRGERFNHVRECMNYLKG